MSKSVLYHWGHIQSFGFSFVRKKLVRWNDSNLKYALVKTNSVKILHHVIKYRFGFFCDMQNDETS